MPTPTTSSPNFGTSINAPLSAAQTQLSQIQNSFEKLSSAAYKFSKEVISAMKSSGIDVDKYNKGLKEGDNLLKEQGKQVGKLATAWRKAQNFLDDYGLSIEKITLAAGIMAYAKFDKQVGITMRRMGSFKNSLADTTTQMQGMGIKSELGSEKFIELANSITEARLEFDATVESGKQMPFTEYIGKFSRIYDIGADKIIEFSKQSKMTLGVSEKAITSALDSVSAVAQKVGMSGADMEETLANMSKMATPLAMSLGKVNAAGKVIFDEKTYLKAVKGMNELAGAYAKAGISASKAGDAVSQLMDVDKIGENAFAMKELGISVQDVLDPNAGEIISKKFNANIGSMATRYMSMGKIARSEYTKMLQGVLGAEEIAKFAAATNKMEGKTEGKVKTTAERWDETKQSMGEALQVLKNLGESIMAIIHPFIPALTFATNAITAILKPIMGLFNHKWFQYLLLGIMAGKLTFGLGKLIKMFSGGGASAAGNIVGTVVDFLTSGTFGKKGVGKAATRFLRKGKFMKSVPKLFRGSGAKFMKSVPKLFRGAGGLMSGMGAKIGGKAVTKGIGKAVLKTGGKLALKTALKAGLASTGIGAILSLVPDIIEGVVVASDTKNLQKVFNTKKVNVGQRLAAGLGGFVSSVSLGILDKDKAMKNIYGFFERSKKNLKQIGAGAAVGMAFGPQGALIGGLAAAIGIDLSKKLKSHKAKEEESKIKREVDASKDTKELLKVNKENAKTSKETLEVNKENVAATIEVKKEIKKPKEERAFRDTYKEYLKGVDTSNYIGVQVSQ